MRPHSFPPLRRGGQGGFFRSGSRVRNPKAKAALAVRPGVVHSDNRGPRWASCPDAASDPSCNRLSLSTRSRDARHGRPRTTWLLLLLRVPLLPDLAAGGVGAEQGLELGVGLLGLMRPQVG